MPKITCSPPQILRGNSCVCPGQLKLINGKCDCDVGFIKRGDSCVSPPVEPRTSRPVVTPAARRVIPTTTPPSKYSVIICRIQNY